MVLNYIWIAFIVLGFFVALLKFLVLGDTEVFNEMVAALFDNAKLGFELSIGLTGVLSLWMGVLKIGENGGAIRIFSRLLAPFFEKLFPDLPKNHPAYAPMMMNFAANMLGLDNAATPLGLKAMEEMQGSNAKKDTASNPMIMFLVLNTSGLTLIPVSVMVYRAQCGAANPSDIFLPILLATFFSTLAGLIFTAVKQKINLFQKTILAYLGSITAIVASIIILFLKLPSETVETYSTLVANFLLLAIITTFILLGYRKKINVYESFIDGAKDGFQIAIKIIPYLIAILVAIGVFRASGTMEWLIDGIRSSLIFVGIESSFTEALPVALMKPLSGSGARGLMVDAMNTYGADSFVGRVASTVQGATDTTFYIIAVYFGSVGIKRTRYAVTAGLFADFVGIIASIALAYLFFA